MTRKSFQISATVIAAGMSAFFSLLGGSFAHSPDFDRTAGAAHPPIVLFALWGLFWGMAVAWFFSGRIFDSIGRKAGVFLSIFYALIGGVIIGGVNDLVVSRPMFPLGMIIGAVLGFFSGIVLSFTASMGIRKNSNK